jgi:hypothetical protein
MINVKDSTVALFDLLQADTILAGLNSRVERSTRINLDPSRCPWIGVYPGTVDTTPKLIAPRTWNNALELQVVAQTASFTDDAAASDELETLIAAIMDVADANLTLGITGLRIIGFSREYRYVQFDDDGSGSLFMPQAVIRVKIEART